MRAIILIYRVGMINVRATAIIIERICFSRTATLKALNGTMQSIQIATLGGRGGTMTMIRIQKSLIGRWETPPCSNNEVVSVTSGRLDLIFMEKSFVYRLKHFLLPLLFVSSIGIPSVINAEALRPPAVPLVACDPYFSIWSPADKLTDVDTTHWTGKPNRLTSQIVIDGKAFRVVGKEPT